ncbi:XRE family transcriptional regulator [Thermomonas sp. HDW16]|uniref:helix-turn-helix domain-containing protein n=1 Tax=Thermomonas sp. HDW16 TaxID=2714945 RepID=UPI00140A37E8|nr:XRE family transcriptional regulator [Thermomonas sp. HDW16]QIL19639.1 ImmA/IrrE family metallo-endopeptidase [Thermomonas sp. HDW16]
MSEPAAVLGANIRLARLFHGLTLEDVAARLDKSRQYVHKIETEQIVPPSETLAAIAELTQVEPAFFVAPAPTPVAEEQCHFRKHFTTRSAIKHVALAKGEMFRRLVAGLEEQLELPAPNIPQYDVSSLVEIERAAEACRAYWGLGFGPIQNMVRVAELAGAVVTSFKGVSREVDAYSISAARPIIVVNSEGASACRQRFDIAHELGHLVLHVGLATGDRKTEGEANRFAGAFLLPRSSFVKEFPRLRGSYLNWQGLSEMKLRWKVSKAALLYRARQLGLISEDQYRTGVIRLNRGGEAKVEREDAMVAQEIPELFTQAVRLGMEHQRMNLEAYSRLFCVKKSVLAEFLAESLASPAPNEIPPVENNVIFLAERRQIVGSEVARRRC